MDALAASFGSRLTPEDRARSFVAPGTPEGLFRVVYRFEHQVLTTTYKALGDCQVLDNTQ